MSSWLVPQLLEHGVALLGSAVLINAGVTFAGALGLALLAARAAGSARVGKWLLLSPWLRLLWDVARGATPDAYVLSEYAGTKGALGSFQLGLGLQSPLVPLLQARLGMQGGERRYAFSIGDGVSHWLYRHLGATPLLVGIAVLLCVSGVLLAARVGQYRAWRRSLAGRGSACVGSVNAGLRRARLFDSGAAGAFTCGVLHPQIWLPASLNAAQRRAVLEHELAHVRELDVLWFGVVGVLADLFWFLPGARLAERQLHERAEQAADARALARGVSARALASGILEQAAASVLSAGRAPRMAGTARRLERRLLALAPRAPLRRWHAAARLYLAAALTASVFVSVFGGYG